MWFLAINLLYKVWGFHESVEAFQQRYIAETEK